jgi:hypothetical protein
MVSVFEFCINACCAPVQLFLFFNAPLNAEFCVEDATHGLVKQPWGKTCIERMPSLVCGQLNRKIESGKAIVMA